MGKHTAWDNHPDEVHSEVVSPEVENLRSAVFDVAVVQIEHAGGIVENQSVHLTNAHNDLERVSQRVGGGNECCNEEAEWSPGELQIAW